MPPLMAEGAHMAIVRRIIDSTVRSVVAVAIAATLALPAAWCGEGLAHPAVLPDSEAYMLLVIPDLQATLTRAEQIGSLFSPAPIPAGTLSAAVGGMLGDPALANLAKGPLMVAVGPGTPTPSVAILLPGTDLQRYIDIAAQKGFLMGKAVGSWAVVAQTPDGQAMGERIAAAFLGMPAMPAGTDIRVLTAPSRLVKAYGAFITGMVQMGTMNIPQQPGQPPIAKIAMLEVAGLIEVLGAVEASQVDISLADRTVAVDQLIAAVPGSALAKALVAPAAGPNRAAQRFSAAPGAVLALLSGKVNQLALNDYIFGLVATLLARPEAKDLLPADIFATVKDLGGALNGELAMRVRRGEKVPWQLDSVVGVGDADKAIHLYDVMFGLFTGDGPIAKFYQGIGMTMVVNKNFRTTGGLPVWQQSWTIDEAKLPPANAAMTKAMIRDNQLVVGPDFAAGSTEPQQLDALVAGKGSGLTTKAETAFGAGRQLYADLDLPALMRGVVSAAAPAPAAGPAPAPAAAPAAPSDPLLAAFTAGDGRQRVELRIPLAPFVGLGATMQALQPARPGRGARPPAAQPPPTGGNTF
jgi:hypothetical protein